MKGYTVYGLKACNPAALLKPSKSGSGQHLEGKPRKEGREAVYKWKKNSSVQAFVVPLSYSPFPREFYKIGYPGILLLDSSYLPIHWCDSVLALHLVSTRLTNFKSGEKYPGIFRQTIFN